MPTYVDVHILQTLPPSNVNRDDAGTPKSAKFGGVDRARVSSQAWKRATRTAFVDQVPEATLGTRTKKITGLLSSRLAERSGREQTEVARVATALATSLGIKPGKKETETSYLLFFGHAQIESLVDLVIDDLPRLLELDEKALEAAGKSLPVLQTLGTGHPVDVALFGRMVADLPALNVDAATQVAHALSTHAVQVEFDYYTAVDDENPKEDTGAGMIGTVEFTSATLYRYATVGVAQLLENLGGDLTETEKALRLFLTSFVTSMPSGHKNSFAHRTAPYLLAIVVRDDQPVNLVSAFEAPVYAHRDGIAAQSAVRLAEELTRVQDLWGLAPKLVAATYSGGDADADHKLSSAFGESVPFAEAVEGAVAAALAAGTGQ